MIIYQVTNLINNKCYIGKTYNLQKRKTKHKYNAYKEKDGKYCNETYFYNAIRLYGFKNFQFTILKDNITDPLILNIMETFMIMVHHSHHTEGGYNLTWGGDGGNTVSTTNRERIIFKRTQTYNMPDVKAKMCKSQKERFSNPLEIEKLKDGRCCKTITTSILSDPTGKIHTIYNMKKFCQGKNLTAHHMRSVANGTRKQHKGWRLPYL